MRLKKWLSKNKSIHKLIDQEGFYIILFLCICIVATTAMWVGKKNIGEIATQDIKTPSLEEKVINTDPFPMVESNIDKPVIVVEDIQEDDLMTDLTVIPREKQDEKEKIKEKKLIKSKVEVKAQKEKTKKMKMPVDGKIGMNYAKDTLIYSKTLEQYTTHYGIDIISKENTPVTAALAGEVVEVSDDPKLGITISLAHDGNMITKYANLSTARFVKVGDYIEKGQKISEIGKTALFEILEEPHLHFEVLIDGKNIDPNKVLHR